MSKDEKKLQIRNLAQRMLQDPEHIEMTPGKAAAEPIVQKVHMVDRLNKRALLIHLITKGDWTRVLVFTRTKHGANKLTEKLVAKGISAAALHSNKSQSFRTRTLEEFKNGEMRTLVATDVAARGLDISNLPYVVNFDIPSTPEDYVHRIGRTGRAGVSGISVSLVSHDEKIHLRAIEKLLKLLKKEPRIGNYLLSVAKGMHTVFCIDERDDETRGYYDFKYNILGLKEHLGLFEKLIIFVHELRHISQFTKGYYNSLDYDIEEIIRMNFAIEADVQAIVTLYAWRMKEIGINEVWDAQSGFSNYIDIAEEFEKEIKRSGDEVKATNAAFVQWYKSKWRVDKYYKCSYSWYVDRLDETKLIQKYIKLPENFFNKLCVLPCEKNYGCHRSDEIKETPQNITKKAKQYSNKLHHNSDYHFKYFLPFFVFWFINLFIAFQHYCHLISVCVKIQGEQNRNTVSCKCSTILTRKTCI